MIMNQKRDKSDNTASPGQAITHDIGQSGRRRMGSR
jgi:hypothetical protein